MSIIMFVFALDALALMFWTAMMAMGMDPFELEKKKEEETK